VVAVDLTGAAATAPSAAAIDRSWPYSTWTPDPAPVTDHVWRAIPYFAWANRGAGPMRVWLPEISGSRWPSGAPGGRRGRRDSWCGGPGSCRHRSELAVLDVDPGSRPRHGSRLARDPVLRLGEPRCRSDASVAPGDLRIAVT